MVLLLSAVGWMAVARIVRGVVLSLKEREFIEASRSVGASGPRIMFRHLIPNALGPIMVALSLSVVGAILA
jgi:ABC-type dipeptide/oligopeptide/nickel transport system permease subunit